MKMGIMGAAAGLRGEIDLDIFYLSFILTHEL
jgi:hypothetical protein